jgi:hypothetical protein
VSGVSPSYFKRKEEQGAFESIVLSGQIAGDKHVLKKIRSKIKIIFSKQPSISHRSLSHRQE